MDTDRTEFGGDGSPRDEHPRDDTSSPSSAGFIAPNALRTPPHNLDAEMALLGALLANNRAYERVADFLLPDHFADPAHGRIYDAIGQLVNAGQLANPVTLKNLFDQDDALSEVGGARFLSQLAGSVTSVINAGHYARVIHDLYLRRELIDLGETVVNDAYSFDLNLHANDQIEVAEQKLFDLATVGQVDRGLIDFQHAMTEAIKMAEAAHRRDGHSAGMPTGLTDLDAKLGGMHASDLIILAGRPSMGKTALATNIAFSAASARRVEVDEEGNEVERLDPVAFFSLEMSAEQLATRILSEWVGVSSEKLRRGEMSTAQFEKLVLASQKLARTPLFIDDTPAISVPQLRTRARRMKRTHGLGLIVVDYLQLLGSPPGRRSENRVLEISEMTRGLKALAKELNVPVVALSQLSRAVEQREDKRPQLADLRESGSIEQDADVVMFVYREQYYLERAEPTQRAEESLEKYNDRHDRWKARCEEVYDTAEVIIAKQRHGPIGTARLRFDGQHAKFGDLAQDSHLPAHH